MKRLVVCALTAALLLIVVLSIYRQAPQGNRVAATAPSSGVGRPSMDTGAKLALLPPPLTVPAPGAAPSPLKIELGRPVSQQAASSPLRIELGRPVPQQQRSASSNLPQPSSPVRIELAKPSAPATPIHKAANAEALRTQVMSLPLRFEPNRGQAADDSQYIAKSGAYEIHFAPNRADLQIAGPQNDRKTLTIGLEGADQNAQIEPAMPLPGKSNYLPESDKKTWITDLPNYAQLQYRRVYPGVDLVFYGNRGRLEYDFIVSPGSDPNTIGLRLPKDAQASIAANGDLQLKSAAGQIDFLKPVIYQAAETPGQRKLVSGKYRVIAELNGSIVKFTVGEYDRSKPLIIDPVLIYSTRAGLPGSLDSLAVDGSGNVYILSTNYQVTVTKLAPDGSTVIYNTAVGNPNYTATGTSIAVDSAGQPHFVSYANSGYPTTDNCYRPVSGGGTHVAYTVLNQAGDGLAYSTYILGSSTDYPLHVAVDSTGKAYISGYTYSTDFPNTGTAVFHGSYDGFITKMDPTKQGEAGLVYSNLVPSLYNNASIPSVAVDANKNAYLAINSDQMNVTNGAYAYNGNYSYNGGTYISKYDATGVLVYTAYLGYGEVRDIAVDGSGNVYATGRSDYGDFPATDGAYQTTYPYGFVTKLNPAGSALVYSTFLSGPSGQVQPQAIALLPGCSSNCSAYVSGSTLATDFPAINAVQSASGGGSDAFMVILSGNGSSASFSSYIGGSSTDDAGQNYYTHIPQLRLDNAGNAYIGGNTYSADFPYGSQTANYGLYVVKIGTNNGASLIPSTYSVDFSSVTIGVPVQQNVILRNYGSATLTLGTPTVTGDFSQSNSCGGSIQPGGSCTMQVTMTATLPAQRYGTITIPHNGVNSPTQIQLSGYAYDQPYITITPQQITFDPQTVNTTSPGQTITVTNTGSQAGVFNGISINDTTNFAQTNNCPSVLAKGASCTITATFTPTNVGNYSTPLYVSVSNARYNGNSYVMMYGAGTLGAATAVISPSSFQFGDQVIGTSNYQILYLTNTGTVPVTITGSSLTGDTTDYSVNYNGCPTNTVVYPGQQCSMYVYFAPTAVGARNASLIISTTASGFPQTVPLTGNGIALISGISYSPGAITFSDQVVGTQSSYQAVVVTNTGTSPLTLERIYSTTPDFILNNGNCATLTLSPLQTCSFYVYFRPTTAGALAGSIVIVDTDPTSPQTITLSGNAVDIVETLYITPETLTFNDTVINTESTQPVYFSNSGNTPITVSSMTIDSSDFTVSYNGCTTIYPDYYYYSCSINVTFSPQTPGAKSATLTVVDSAEGSPHTMTLHGNAVDSIEGLILTPQSYFFPDQVVGTTSSYATFVLYNTGTSPVHVSSLATSGDFSTANYCSTIYPGDACTAYAQFTPTAAGLRTGTLTIFDDAPGNPHTIALSGNGLTAVSTVVVSPSTVNFFDQAVGTTSDQQGIYFYNTGNAFITVSNVKTTTADFTLVYNGCSGGIYPDSYCYVQVTFTPTVAGKRTGAVTMTDSAQGSPHGANLAGNGLAASKSLTLSPASLDFGDLVVNGNAGSQNTYLVNSGTQPVRITSITGSANVTAGQNCVTTLNPGVTCGMNVTFSVKNTGTQTGTVTITSDATGSPQTVNVTADGVSSTPQIWLAPNGLAYDKQATNTTSNQQVLNFHNDSGSTVTVSNVAATAGFSVNSNNCNVVGNHSSCSVGITFTPTSAGVVSGTVTFTHNGPGGTITAKVTGYGVAASKLAEVNPAGLGFLDQVTGTSSNVQYVYVYNVGTLPLTASNVTISSDFVISYNGCTGQINVNSYCYVGVKFQPSAAGLKNGVLTITDDSTTSPHTISLTGTGEAPTNPMELTASLLNFNDQPVGTQSTIQTVYLYNTGNTTINLGSISLTGSDFIFSYKGCGTTIPAGSYCYLQLAFTPQSTGAKSSTVTVQSDSVSGTQTVSLSGKGIAATKTIVVGTDSLQFSDTPVGVTNNQNQYFYVYNNGTLPVTFTAPAVTGDFSNNYNGCSTVQPHSYCYMYLQFTPTAVGNRTGTIQLNDDANGNPHLVSLNGTGIAVNKTARLSVNAMAFPDQSVGITSQSQYVYLYNQGNVPLTVTDISLTTTGDFAVGYQSCGTPPFQIAVNSYCYMYFSFTPTTTGNRTGQLTITDDAVNSPQTMSLSGKGVTANASITVGTTGLVFPPQEVSTTSAQQYFYVYNEGNVPITFGTPSIDNPDFAISYNGCSSFNSPGQSCYMYVTFTPSTTGTRTGTLSIPSNAKNSPATLSLSGKGIATGSGAQFSQTSVAFGNQVVNTQSAGVTVYYTNQGGTAIHLTSTTISPSDFIKDSGCDSPRTIGPKSFCAVTLYFKPGTATNLNGALTIADDATGSPHTISLSGVGVNAFPTVVLTPSILSFGNQLVGVASSVQYVTVNNTGTAPLHVTDFTNAPADYSVTYNSCGSPVAPHSYCQFGLTFTPTKTGAINGSFTVFDDAPDQSQSITLTGTGLSASPIVGLSTSNLNFSAYAIGSTSPPQSFTLYNTGNATLNITSIVASLEFNQTNNCGTSLAAGSNCVINVTFTPTGLGTRTGTVTITDNAQGSPHLVSLTGTGLNAKGSQVTPASIIFANQTVGTTSPSQPVTIVATGATLTVGSVSLDSGDFAQTNNCTTTLNYGQQCAVNVTFTPSVVGNRTAVMTITDDSPTSPHLIQLSGNGLGSPTVSLSKTSLNFNSVNKGETSAPQTVTLTNTGNGPLGIGSITASGDYAQTNNCSPNLNPNVSCDITVTFTPTTYGTRTGTVTINDNAVGNPHLVSLTGVGLAPGAQVNPTSLTFGTQAVGSTSAPKTLTLTDVGTLPLNISSIGSTSSEFPETNNCPATLGVNASCTISVKFAPTAAGQRTGSIVIQSDGGNLNVSLTGTGTGPVATLDQTSLNFGSINVGTTSAKQTVKLTSSGDSALTITSITTTGDYAQTNDCPSTLNVNASCNIQITFTPTAPGQRNGTLKVADNAANSPQQVTLSGTGIGATITFNPPSLDFSTQFVGTTSTPQSITLSNGGTSNLTISEIKTSGDFAQTNDCPSVLIPSGSCTASVTFSPTTSGQRNGQLLVTANNNTSAASLTGVGVTQGLSFSPNSLSFGSLLVGLKSQPKTVTVTAVGTLPVTFTSIVVTGDYEMTHNCPTTLQANASCTVTVDFAPTQQGLRQGTVTFTDDATGSPQTVALSGTGTQPTADLAVTGSVIPKSGPPGTTATYTVVVKNNGPSPATNVALTLTAPTNASLQSVTPSLGECTGTSTITCSVANLASGQSFNVVMVANNTKQGPMTTNTSATATEADNNTANNSLSLTCDTSEADIEVIGTSTTTVLNGQTAFTVSVRNDGPSNATNVTATYEFNRFGYIASAPTQGACAWDGVELICNFGSVSVGATASVTVAVQPPDSGWSSIDAHATSDQWDNNPVNNRVQINPTQDGYNTKTGNNVSVDISDPHTGATANLVLATVTRPGVTTLAATNGMAPPSGYRSPRANLTYDVSTSAQYNGAVTFTLHFNPATLWHPAEARLFHNEAGVWVDRTTALNPVGAIAGVTGSLSEFAIFEPPNQAPVSNPGGTVVVPGTNPSGNVVQLNGSLSSDGESDALTYKWTGPFPEGNGTVTGSNPRVTLPIGSSQIALVVNDGETDSDPVTQSVTVSDFAVSANVTALTVNRGQSANLSVILSPKFAAYDRAVTLGCSNLPADLTCQFEKDSITPGANGSTVTLTIVAAKTTAAVTHPSSPRMFALWTLALGLPFGFVSIVGNRKRRLTWVLLAIVLVATLYMAGCGGGGGGSSFQNPPPPTGQTSTINVTATSSGITHAMSLTVTRN